tara:strand:- start:116 stop:364 length:249 start_codon:yes stop_codon:yes gene_type:complete
MTKRVVKKVFFLEPLDLHGIKHSDVSKIVEDFILEHQDYCPLKIITGNSLKMKNLVKKVLDHHRFKYVDGDYYNRGYIDVLS